MLSRINRKVLVQIKGIRIRLNAKQRELSFVCPHGDSRATVSMPIIDRVALQVTEGERGYKVLIIEMDRGRVTSA